VTVTAGMPVLDDAVLADLLALDEDGTFLQDLFTTYLEQAESALKDIHDAVEDFDAGRLRRAAHYLGGASANIGAMKVAAACRELELARSGEAAAKALTTAIEHEAHVAAAAIRAAGAHLAIAENA